MLTWKIAKRYLANHMPQILLGAAIGGTVATTGFAVYGTVKTVRALDTMQPKSPVEHVDTVDKVKAVAKYWVPTGIALGSTIFFICELNAVHLHREAALAALGAMWQSKYTNLKEALNESNCKQKEEIQRAAMEKEIKGSSQVAGRDVLSEGELLCYEPYSRQRFIATPQQLLWAELTANKEYAARGFLSLNDFLMMLPGCKQVNFGSNFGWFPGCNTKSWVYAQPHEFVEIDTTLQTIEDHGDVAVLQYSVPMDNFLADKYK